MYRPCNVGEAQTENVCVCVCVCVGGGGGGGGGGHVPPVPPGSYTYELHLIDNHEQLIKDVVAAAMNSWLFIVELLVAVSF